MLLDELRAVEPLQSDGRVVTCGAAKLEVESDNLRIENAALAGLPEPHAVVDFLEYAGENR